MRAIDETVGHTFALSRRDALRVAIAGTLVATTWPGSARAAVPPPPKITFGKSKVGDGVSGPYGEVRIGRVGQVTLPVQVVALADQATIDLSGREPFVLIGSGASAFRLTASGVQFDSRGKPVPWDGAVIRRLIDSVAKDSAKARGALLLRSTLHTAYPVALRQSKGSTGKSVGQAFAGHAGDLGASALTKCSVTTVTETVVNTVTQAVEVWKTAEQQYQECYDREIAKDPCRSAGIAAGACAAGICAVNAFVDILVGIVEVVSTVTEEVVRTVIRCATPPRGFWPNPWTIPGPSLSKGVIGQAGPSFDLDDVNGARKLLNEIAGFLGPFAKCLLGGQWSLAALDIQLSGDGAIAIPYGVRVCVDSQCASSMVITNVLSELGTSWGAALAVLAALSAEFAAFAATIGITAAPAVAAAVAAAGPVVAACAAIILAFILLALIYGTLISAQLAFHQAFTGNFADGKVCIEHATFALGLIKLATLGIAPSELIPPIVTG